ncbi:amino acid ABC transporter permease [Pseudarthrobacter sp. fls2-241-R2A-168]|uniref:amino acid ABC transporter permease n=1 Tax=Pseudarthrobacter sp. fls2-241-R2A-168 TaxID=3040304 RepID=UPI002556B6B5|nr:amino acid ABC transporter permease [Pseudarthrobacter sp. fls2-241-R2A-168]
MNIFDNFFNFEVMLKALPEVLTYGFLNTLLLSLFAMMIGLVVGLLLAILGVSQNSFLRAIARVYTDLFRGLPAILTILVVGSILAQPLSGLTKGNPYVLAIIALGLIVGAYIGEIFRGAIQSVDPGQMEASRALGVSYGTSMRRVIVPQAVRTVLPSLMNQLIAVIKDSSLVYVLGLTAGQRELFRIGQDASITNGNLSPLVLAGVSYLLITVPLTHLVNVVDKRMRKGKNVKAVIDPEQDLMTGTIKVQERGV